MNRPKIEGCKSAGGWVVDVAEEEVK